MERVGTSDSDQSSAVNNRHHSTSNLFNRPSLSCLGDGKNASGSTTEVRSPKVFGLPKPYTGLYSASSYMANRPSYMRTRYVRGSNIACPLAHSRKPSSTGNPANTAYRLQRRRRRALMRPLRPLIPSFLDCLRCQGPRTPLSPCPEVGPCLRSPKVRMARTSSQRRQFLCPGKAPGTTER